MPKVKEKIEQAPEMSALDRELFLKYQEDRIEKGNVVIDKVVVDELMAARSRIQTPPSVFSVEAGIYVRLRVDNTVMMSNTQMERRTNVEVLSKAHGKVLIGGLGIGMLLPPLLRNPLVSRVLVIENNQNVIDLVAHRFRHRKLEVVCESVFEFGTEERFNTIYLDIWNNVSRDNLPEMKLLHQKYRKMKDPGDPNFWINSWTYDMIRAKWFRTATGQ